VRSGWYDAAIANSRRNLFAFSGALVATLWVAPISDLSVTCDKSIRAAIEHSAEQLTTLQGTDVEIAVENGNVVLLGTVRLYIQKMDYERIAWTTDGVEEVESEIRVVPKFTVPDATIRKSIRAIVNDDARFRATELTFTVTWGSVVLDATFENPNDVLLLKRLVAEIEGVTAIVIESAFRV
jgi:osmotically-inducible protein OsmY